MNFEKYGLIQEEIAKELWKVMPLEAIRYIFKCEIYENPSSYQMFWIKNNGDVVHYQLGEFPDEGEKILKRYVDLKEIMSKDGNNWTQSVFILNENGSFEVEFAYIDEEDSWPMLYMKGVSDLTKEEAEEYYIPLEIWEERVRLKKEKV